MAFVFLVLVAIAGTPALAEVTDSSETGFRVRNVVQIPAHPSRVYSALTERVNRWWDPAHTYSRSATNLTLDPRAGGCLCEGVPGGGGAVHLTVVYVVPLQEIRFAGALGPLQQMGVSGSMTWKLAGTGGDTQVEWVYTVGGYGQGGLARIAPAVDAVLAAQLQRLKRFVETGRPE